MRQSAATRGTGPLGEPDEIEKMKTINGFIQDLMVEVKGGLSTDGRRVTIDLNHIDVDYCCKQKVGDLHACARFTMRALRSNFNSCICAL